MKLCVAGASGAFGVRHMDAIEGETVTSVVGTRRGAIRELLKSAACTTTPQS